MPLQNCWRALATSLVFATASACGGGGGGDNGGGGNGPPNIAAASLDGGVVGMPYSQTVTASGGTGTKTFSISAGALPAGLSISAGGAITGTPAGPAGDSEFTVSVSDSAATPRTDTQALSIAIVDPLLITTASVPDTSAGADYNVAVAVTGGTAPYSFSVAPGNLPAGLSIGVDGTITGTVAASARSEAFTIEVADSSVPALTATRDYAIGVALEITTTALPDATSGQPYTASLDAAGGQLPLDWSILSGNLHSPLGLVPSTGVISGTPDAVCAAATTVLDVQVSDAAAPAQSDSQAGIAFTLNPAALDISTPSLPAAVVGAAYDQRITATGGVPPYNFAITGGILPSQLALDASNGRITGTPDTVETQSFEVTVTDSCPGTATGDLSIVVSNVSLGRNDSIATATVLPGNGTYSASISPSGHPNTVFNPDEDYYRITTSAASTVTVDINAVANGSPLDSVIEITGGNGVPLNTCVSPTFNSPCQHDDEDTAAGLLDSFLQVRVAAGANIYIHVVDWGSNARPDKLYDLVISGVN